MEALCRWQCEMPVLASIRAPNAGSRDGLPGTGGRSPAWAMISPLSAASSTAKASSSRRSRSSELARVGTGGASTAASWAGSAVDGGRFSRDRLNWQGQVVPNYLQEGGHVDRLVEERLGTCGEDLFLNCSGIPSACQNDGFKPWKASPEFLYQLPARHSRQLELRDQQIRRLAGEQQERLLAGRCIQDLDTPARGIRYPRAAPACPYSGLRRSERGSLP